MYLEDKKNDMIVYEAFLRRASMIDLPFMLKGSYVTRQYMKDPAKRIPSDIDWVYMGALATVDEAKTKFDEWVIKVTEQHIDDGVTFKSFRENAFWRMIDYAMADDFPTVNTDVYYSLDGEFYDCVSFDLSFNLSVDIPPQPLLYKPLLGDAFTLPYTVPLPLQISWKLHQTLVRPRFKDIFDLIYLLEHPSFDNEMLQQTLQALVNECAVDNVDVYKLKWLVLGQLDKIFLTEKSLNDTWNCWRGIAGYKYNSNFVFDLADYITDSDKLPDNVSVFTALFQTALFNAGITIGLFNNLPMPTKASRKEETKEMKSVEIDKITQTVLSGKSVGYLDYFKKMFGKK